MLRSSLYGYLGKIKIRKIQNSYSERRKVKVMISNRWEVENVVARELGKDRFGRDRYIYKIVRQRPTCGVEYLLEHSVGGEQVSYYELGKAEGHVRRLNMEILYNYLSYLVGHQQSVDYQMCTFKRYLRHEDILDRAYEPNSWTTEQLTIDEIKKMISKEEDIIDFCDNNTQPVIPDVAIEPHSKSLGELRDLLGYIKDRDIKRQGEPQHESKP